MEKLILNHINKKVYHLKGFTLIDIFSGEVSKDLEEISNMQSSSIKPCEAKYFDTLFISNSNLKEALDNLEKSIVSCSLTSKVWWDTDPLKVSFSIKGVDEIFKIIVKKKKNGNIIGIIESKNRPILVRYILTKMFKQCFT